MIYYQYYFVEIDNKNMFMLLLRNNPKIILMTLQLKPIGIS